MTTMVETRPPELAVEIRNETETVVWRALSLRDGGREKKPTDPFHAVLGWFSEHKEEKRASCDCPMCRADVVAFSLTKLPPCYARGRNYGVAMQGIDADRVRAAVELGLKKVSHRPLHPPRTPIPVSESVRLVDYGLEAGSQIVKPLLSAQRCFCVCPDCVEDTLAYGLNRAAPRFGVESRGRRRIPVHFMEFLRHEVGDSILRAARVIAANPRH